MSTYITPNRILDFTLVLKRENRPVNTINSYTMGLQKLELFLDGSELSKDMMLSYKEWLTGQGFKHCTVNAYLAAANYFCEVMGWQDMKVRLDSVTAEEAEKSKQTITYTDYKKLVYTALQNDKERIAMIMQVVCHMGLRFCELEHMTVEALERGYLVVERKKREIRIDIPDMLLEDLKAFAGKEQITSGIIFRTNTGAMINRSNFRKELRKLCALAGVDEELGSIQHMKNVVPDSYPYFGIRKD